MAEQNLGGDQVLDESVIHVDMAFVLGQVALFMGPGQDAPDFGTQPQRVGKDLENNIAIPGAVTVPAQRRQA